MRDNNREPQWKVNDVGHGAAARSRRRTNTDGKREPKNNITINITNTI